jgi:hypothetical protein
MLIFQASHVAALFLDIVAGFAKPQSRRPAIFRRALELRQPSG